MTQPATLGVHHLGLTVPNLEQARRFFCDGLGWRQIGARPEYPAIFISDGCTTLTLWQVAHPAHFVHFDRRNNVGLHHLALAVADDDTLRVVFDQVSHLDGVRTEFSPKPIQSGSTVLHFICIVPGGLRIEFATRPKTSS